MTGADIFDLYRRTLAIVFGTYSAIRLVGIVWRWQMATRHARGPEGVFRRYVVIALLRVRLRRFWLDAVQIVGLSALLGYLVWLHVR